VDTISVSVDEVDESLVRSITPAELSTRQKKIDII